MCATGRADCAPRWDQRDAQPPTKMGKSTSNAILSGVKQKFCKPSSREARTVQHYLQQLGLLVCLCYPQTLLEVIASFLNAMVSPVADALLHVSAQACVWVFWQQKKRKCSGLIDISSSGELSALWEFSFLLCCCLCLSSDIWSRCTDVSANMFSQWPLHPVNNYSVSKFL